MIKNVHWLLFLMMSCSGGAQNSPEKEVKGGELHVHSTPDFEISGDGISDPWKNADWVSLPSRNENKAGYHTRVKLLYSSKGIYCLFLCEDRKITATRTADFSDLYNEDVVEIFFWPDETVPVYFEYELSPHNYELAIVVPNLKGNFYGWRPWNYEGDRLTRHAAKITRDEQGVASWNAEFFIPYSLLKPLLKSSPQKGSHWRANMYRIDYDEGAAEFSWQLTGENFHDYEKFGTLIFD